MVHGFRESLQFDLDALEETLVALKNNLGIEFHYHDLFHHYNEPFKGWKPGISDLKLLNEGQRATLILSTCADLKKLRRKPDGDVPGEIVLELSRHKEFHRVRSSIDATNFDGMVSNQIDAALCEAALCTLWETMGYRHGYAMPMDAFKSLRNHRSPDPRPPPPREDGLPWLFPNDLVDMPFDFCWLNYWSPDVAKALDFPDCCPDASFMSMSRQLPSGAWLVKLSEDYLDPTKPEVFARVREAYERIPKLGLREMPEKWKDLTISEF